MRVLEGVVVCTVVLLLSLGSCAAGNATFNIHPTVLRNPVSGLPVCLSLKQTKLCKTGILTCMGFTVALSQMCLCSSQCCYCLALQEKHSIVNNL